MKIQKMLVLAVLIGVPSVFAESLEAPLNIQKQINESGAQSQKRIDSLSTKSTEAVAKYRSSIQRAEGLEVYNAQLKKLVESQREEMLSISRQVGEIENIETGVMPLMLKMTDTLDKLIAADAPFLINEREERVRSLHALLDRADVSVGEKFRRIMEAYTIETEYGRTIEAYQGELVLEDKPITVDLLRVGRIGLYYQTLDGDKTGRWSKKDKKWVELDSEFRRPILDGLRIARKQAQPEMLKLAVDASGE
jgi:hypothetical protein